MKFIIDADSCPVVESIIQIAKKANLSVIIVKSFAHYSLAELPSHVQTIYVDSDAEAADYKIVEQTKKDDIIITQDYGLASLILNKDAYVFHHKGFQYTNENIQSMLDSRYLSAMQRKSGQRTRGPKPFTKADEQTFINLLTDFLQDHH